MINLLKIEWFQRLGLDKPERQHQKFRHMATEVGLISSLGMMSL